MSELYRDFIDSKADQIINSLGGTITPAPANAELYRDFLDRKFDDVINALPIIKTLEYTGKGSTTNEIDFGNVTPKIIFMIQGNSGAGDTLPFSISTNIIYGKTMRTTYRQPGNAGQAVSELSVVVSYSGNKMTLTCNNNFSTFNTLGNKYTVYYI